MKVLWLAIMMAAPALGAYNTWTECSGDKVSNCDCTFECYEEGKEVKICQCDCDNGPQATGKAKFWYDCDSENCKDSDDCKESSDDCKKDRLYESEEKDCKKKDNEGDCEDCCEVQCKKYHNPTKCNYWYEDCVKDCIEDAPCDEAGDSSDQCDFLSYYQYKRCGDKSSKSKCKNCCWDECGDENPNSSRCRDKCYYEAKSDADCSNAGDDDDDDEGKCEHREDECCNCVDRCVRKKKGWKKEKVCIKNKCKDDCKDGAEACSGHRRSEWKDFVEDKCDFHY